MARQTRKRPEMRDTPKQQHCMLVRPLGRYRLQAKGFTVQGDREAFTVLDQGEECAVQPIGGTGGIV
jgi:hypothetical protein